MEKDVVIPDEQLKEAIRHVDAACSLMGMAMKLLFKDEEHEQVIGFVLGPREMFEEEDFPEPYQDEGIIVPSEVPTDPKKLN